MPFVKKMITLSTLWVLTACGTIDMSAVSTLIFPARTSYPTPTGTMTLPPSATQNATTADMLAYRVQAARKMMQANAGSTFTGSLPDPLASIPVIEIHLNADGSIRTLDVVRTPSFYPETVEMAKAAIHRAAPFGSVAHLPKPWTFNETFLYNDALKFQLHALQP